MDDNQIIENYKKYEPFFGGWYLKRFIGEGGFAKVFEIVRNDFGKEYVSALKIITVSKTKSEINTLRSEGMTDEDIREYLRGIVEDTVREIQLMYELKGNGNIVGYEDHAVMEHEDGMGWDILIKMEYLTSLSSYIRQNKGRLAKRDVVKLGIDICKALESCQKYSVIHRDIKADNIFVAKSGDFKLGDFGIARVIERKDQTLSKKGTSAYMAPEVYKGQTYTSAVDIYSLEMVLYRLLNNNRGPFLPEYPKSMSLDDRDRALMMRMSGEKFPKPSQAGRSRLTEIVLKACAYSPEERYSSPGFMRQELEAILIDRDEITTEEMIMIYEEGRSDTTSSRQSTPIVPQREETTAAMEVLREDEATEALRPESASEEDATEIFRQESALEDDATEVLRSEATEVLCAEDATEVLMPEPVSDISASDPVHRTLAPTKKLEVKMLCKKCGGIIDCGMTFCPACGANQEVAKGSALSKKESRQRAEKAEESFKEKSFGKLLAIYAGIVAALTVYVFGMACADWAEVVPYIVYNNVYLFSLITYLPVYLISIVCTYRMLTRKQLLIAAGLYLCIYAILMAVRDSRHSAFDIFMSDIRANYISIAIVVVGICAAVEAVRYFLTRSGRNKAIYTSVILAGIYAAIYVLFSLDQFF